ncbi:uncharacterized protein NEMAJ01_0491 [Nematocida major]|uniref:uncharacterized protein n=1 Tax=Nematocida major TaxID=1912982 RepID=UPI0020080013|nr:uncharacterized protein NEMAJ01_0491 [Nematocida major]KAH9385595.1 hypothetical protein NEMAJ01_0491 [Nematocida major]
MERLSVVECLQMRYLNERESKRILPYDEDLMGRAHFLLHRQKTREREEANRNRTKEHVYRIETERIEWLLTEYLLVRMEKIRSDFYKTDLHLLSEEEREYQQEYIRINTETELRLPEEEIPERHREENSSEVHGIYVLDDLQDVVIDGEILTLSPGEFLIGDISTAEDLVNDLAVLLV